MFIVGWAIWFFIDKQPASLGVIVPDELDTILDNFQLAFDMLKDGFLRASFVFIWKAHYIILSVIAGVMASIMFEAASNIFRRRHLRQLMWPNKLTQNKTEKQDPDEPS